MPQRDMPLPSFAVPPGIPGALTLFVDTPDSPSLYYVIPSVAEESRACSLIIAAPDSPSLYYVIPSVAEESKMPTLDFLLDF